MRASEQESTGSAGVSAVCANFELIGWAPARNEAHDLGTDLLVAARDFRRFDRGLIVGVQVKSGSSWFERPQVGENGEVAGWWYRESRTEHFENWVMHGLPHLLVLHDLDDNVSYWTHVTAEAVKTTGTGCKIVVPKGQTIDRDHAEALFAVASNQRAAPSLEGTALWDAPGAIAPQRRLRYALVAPRLVAPHPNAGYGREIDAVEGVALAAQGRFVALKEFAEKHSGVPDLEHPAPGCDWTWLFMAAIWHWSATGSVERLRSVFDTAPTEYAKAASGVLFACALARLERHSEALQVLDGLVTRDRLQPVDHGWVLIQRSRMRLEVGDIAGARADAVEAQRDFVGDADDVTVSALAAAAAWQMFMTVDFGEQDLAEMITASDTAVSWWRSQTISSALDKAEETRFKQWAEDCSQPLFHTGDPEPPELFAAELSADVTAEQGRWRAVSALRARQRLMRASACDDEINELVEGLGALRRSGDYRLLQLAVAHIQQVGPLKALAKAVSDVPLDGWTHSAAGCNFETVTLAGDLLDEERASGLLSWSLRLVEGDSADFISRVRPDFNLRLFALKAVTGLLPATSPRMHGEVARLIARRSPAPQELVLGLGGAVGFLDFDQVAVSEREALWEFGQQDRGRLGAEVLNWLAGNGNSHARAALVDRTLAGDRYGFRALGDVRELDDAAAAALIARFESAAWGTVHAAQNRHYIGGDDGVSGLTLLNLCFPREARWDAVFELLCEPLAAVEHKRAVGAFIGDSSAQLPEDVRAGLTASIEPIASSWRGFSVKADIGGMHVVVGIASGAIDGDDADAAATRLACGTPRERQDLALLLGSRHCPNMQAILAALVTDPDVKVRAEAARAVGKLADTNPIGPLSELAWALTRSNGTLLVSELINGLSRRDAPLSDLGVEIAQHLSRHDSARVRHRTGRLLRRARRSRPGAA